MNPIAAERRIISVGGALCATAMLAAGTSRAGDGVSGVRGLISRVMPDHAAQVACEIIPADGGRDVFEIESRDGRVVLRGNDASSLSFGLHWYLKYVARCSVSLNGSQLRLPATLPPVPAKVRMTGWARSRYALNYCTFSYSMPWWNWEQWERFIDWMALNGVNQPLAVTGQEAVWQAVCRRFGIGDGEIAAFLAGPPYLPFQWMGCLDGHGGPLPADWIAKRTELQRKILARERELGMTPVLQGFTGHVPEPVLRKFPGTKAHRIQWTEFQTWMLDPTDPLFQTFGTAFIEEQTRLFGTDHLYDADSFIEMTPPSGDPAYLAEVGRATHAAMAAADPQAVWVLESWPFHPARPFWTQERVRALLGGVPDDRVLVLDLHCDVAPLWRQREGFFGKPWVWSFIFNFGNNTILGGSGPLPRFDDLAAVRKDPLAKNLRGVGLMMEGFDHNPLFADLMFEMAWRDGVDLRSWVQDFARFRYGTEHPAALAAWETLRTGPYGVGVGSNGGKPVVVQLPSPTSGHHRHAPEPLAAAYRHLLEAAPELAAVETYRHDLVNVARQALSNRAGELHRQAMDAFRAKDAAAFRQKSGEFLGLIRDLDEVLATNEEFVFGRWIADAKRWGADDAERAKLEWNARRIVTLWGSGTALRDYAWRESSGLMSGFYGRRWEIFLGRAQEALERGVPFDQAACHAEIARFETAWCSDTAPLPVEPVGDSVAVARRLFAKYMR